MTGWPMIPDPPLAAGPSPHLSWDELACWDRRVDPPRLVAVYPVDWRGARAALLAREFEAVRAALAGRLGRVVPLIVNSAYRTPAHNRVVGGSPRSQHVYGRALDLRPADARALDALYDVARRRAESVGAIRGLGRYDTFVHMDTRPTAELALWDERTR